MKMARIETWYDQDLQEAVKVRYIDGNVFSQDNNGNVVGVRVFNNGADAAIAGTVSGTVIRSDGASVAITGTRTNNKCSIILPQAAYSVPGVISIIIKLKNGDDITTLCAVVANVYVSATDTVVDPGMIIPDIAALIATIEAAVDSIPLDYSALSDGFYKSVETEFGLTSSGSFVDATIDRATGTTVTSTVYKTTGFMPVKGALVVYTTSPAINATVLSSRATISFYSGQTSDTYISSEPFQQGQPNTLVWQTTSIPDGANYMRVTIGADVSAAFKCIQVFPIDTVLTYKGNITAEDDVDNYLTSGMWHLYTTVYGIPANWASSTVGTLVVRATTTSTGAGTQQYILDYNGQLWSRYKRAQAFTGWRKVLDNGNIYTDIIPAVIPYTFTQLPTPTSAFDLNDLTSPGMYSIGDVSLAAHYPSTETGRLIVFGDPNSTVNRIIQFVIDNDYSVYVRYISAAAQRWFRLGTEARGTITASDDCNNYTKNGQFSVSSASAANWASDKTGKLIVFGDEISDTNRIVQLAIDYQANTFIRYKSIGWSKWRSLTASDSVQTVTVKASGGDFTTIPAAVKYVTDQFDMNSDQKWLIKIDPGTYDIADEVVDLISEGEINSQGLFINPHVTICGAGKDKTIIRFLYTGQDDNVMSNVSLFNMPYESCLMDCTLICQNIRYCIHSALNATGMSTKYIDDVTIRCANVKMEHLGFDSQHTPTYFSPGCFGSGSTNGGKKEFYNCDFTANYTPWFNHNRKNLTKATEFIFEGCAFIRLNPGSSLNLITWIDDPQNYVTFRHCHINRYMSFSIRTDSLGDPNNKNGYYVTSDGDLIVAESTVNNSQLDDNYMDAYCQKLIAAEAISAYTPVSSNTIAGVRNYVNTDARKGVALNSVTSGGICCVKLGGHLLLDQLTSTTFAVGKNLGWNGSAWVEDNTNPIVKVVYSRVVEIL